MNCPFLQKKGEAADAKKDTLLKNTYLQTLKQKFKYKMTCDHTEHLSLVVNIIAASQNLIQLQTIDLNLFYFCLLPHTTKKNTEEQKTPQKLKMYKML